MLKNSLLFLAFFIIGCCVLLAQDGQSGVPPELPALGNNDETVYVIRGVDFGVDGRTKASALVYYGEFVEGERIEGLENLEKYLVRKQQLIMNKRNHDEVTVEYTLGEAEQDGAVPVNLVVNVVDTWNFIILPEPKYDSNEGFSLTLKARDYNFLGTMSPLRLDIGYLFRTKDNENENVFNLALDSDIPFYALGLRWNLNFDNIFEYTVGDPLQYKNVSGLSIELPAGSATAALGVNQYFIVNEGNSQSDIDEYGIGARFTEPYAATELFSSLKIPTNFVMGGYGAVDYTVSLSGKISYRPGGVDQPRRPQVSLGQSLGFGRVNWDGNYRNGLEASIANTNNFYFDPDAYRISINAVAAVHHRFSYLFGISARLQYWQWFNGLDYDAAGAVRGLPNSDLRLENMLSLNADFPFRILRFAPSEWFDTRKLRLFDFDMHLSPFVDIAFARGQQKPFPDAINFSDGIFCGGFEIIVFPDFFRSLYLRISSGYNIKQAYNTGQMPLWDELFIGIGHFF